jgi:hypothetical protein
MLVNRVKERRDKLLTVLKVRGPRGESSYGSYFVDAWGDLGTPHEEAVKLAKDYLTLVVALLDPSLFGLEAILADPHTSEALRKFLIDDDPGIWRLLAVYVSARKPRGKRGPRPKDGKHKKDLFAELRATGLTHGQIALKILGDASKRNIVSATLSQQKKKSSTRPAER